MKLSQSTSYCTKIYGIVKDAIRLTLLSPLADFLTKISFADFHIKTIQGLISIHVRGFSGPSHTKLPRDLLSPRESGRSCGSPGGPPPAWRLSGPQVALALRGASAGPCSPPRSSPPAEA